MWGFEHAGIVPDVVTLAKGIANGLPLAAMVASGDLMRRWGVGAHGSTFGGNPVSCAAGVAVLETIREERLVENAAARGAELTAGLQAIAAEDPRIGDVRGPGPDDRASSSSRIAPRASRTAPSATRSSRAAPTRACCC